MPQDRFFSARVFSPAFKLAAVSRVEAGEPIGAVARDLGLARRVLYRWREAWRVEGAVGLSRKRGRKVGWRKRPPGGPPGGRPKPAAAAAQLAQAEMRIAELERLVGRQQSDLDFFRRALQTLDATTNESASATASTRSSKQ
jgi:transposase-like protein